MKTKLVAALLLACALPAHAGGLLDVAAPTDAPQSLTAIIEIPAGTSVKYELTKEGGRIFVDRFLSMPMAYPANYGSVAGTRNVDGDPLDILVYTRAPIVPGALIRVRPIGTMQMTDKGETDDKIIAVPVSKVDPTYDAIRTIDDLPQMERNRLLAFFRVYKDLPGGSEGVSVLGFGDIASAHDQVRAALVAGSGK